jgi:hypothetical protein
VNDSAPTILKGCPFLLIIPPDLEYPYVPVEFGCTIDVDEILMGLG